MGLSQLQKSMLEKARSGGASDQGISLSDKICNYLLAVIARDLGVIENFPELPSDLPPFFESGAIGNLQIAGIDFLPMFERLMDINADADTYFACLANLHKRRLKYERILQTQALPTIDQVGPRGLLQFGTMSAKSLAALLYWRKWFFDIDNRAGQETGYLFEPIIAHAIGGSPFGAAASPVRRVADRQKGRQVDCIRDKRAYEFKMRVTIASSGQGRWREELDFPADCRASDYIPVLIVLDPTPNSRGCTEFCVKRSGTAILAVFFYWLKDRATKFRTVPNSKLEQLEAVFMEHQGEVYKGDAAWRHLDGVAGPTMALFLEKYVHRPLQSLFNDASPALPDFTASLHGGNITLSVGGELLHIIRSSEEIQSDDPEFPEGAADQMPGP